MTTQAPTDPASPAAVLWDMDGTLIDTEPYWTVAERDLVLAHGGTWTPEVEASLGGCGLVLLTDTLIELGVQMAPTAILTHISDSVMAQVAEQMPWRPGSRELLEQIKRNRVPTALVTMSTREIAVRMISEIGFHAFDFVISGEDVDNEKPHPEPYLTAASALGVSITECVAIEDSLTGATAALASGAVTIGVPHQVPLDSLDLHATWPTLANRSWDDLRAVFGGVQRGHA